MLAKDIVVGEWYAARPGGRFCSIQKFKVLEKGVTNGYDTRRDHVRVQVGDTTLERRVPTRSIERTWKDHEEDIQKRKENADKYKADLEKAQYLREAKIADFLSLLNTQELMPEIEEFSTSDFTTDKPSVNQRGLRLPWWFIEQTLENAKNLITSDMED